MPANSLVIAVILNTNRRDDTLACLRSLARSSYDSLSAIVLDNASSDGSMDAIRREFPDVEVVSLAENKGYAGNNNVGIQRAIARGAEWVLVLNEDTLLDPDCVRFLVEAGQADPRIGIVGPMVYHANEPQLIQSAGGRLDRFWRPVHFGQHAPDVGQFPDVHAVDWVSGCALMIRRETILDAGMLDERFFYYWEETEWCFRTRGHGWQIVHVPHARLWHKGVQRDYRPSPAVTYYNTRNRLLFLSKHRAPLLAWAVTCAGMLRTLTSWTVRPKWRGLGAHRHAMRRGIVDFLRGRTGMAHL